MVGRLLQYGMSVTLILLNQAEHIYRTVSVLDLDTELQTQWQVFLYSSLLTTRGVQKVCSLTQLTGYAPVLFSSIFNIVPPTDMHLAQRFSKTWIPPLKDSWSWSSSQSSYELFECLSYCHIFCSLMLIGIVGRLAMTVLWINWTLNARTNSVAHPWSFIMLWWHCEF